MSKYYLTTPLYYVNAKPHIGHSYTNIAADTLARFKRLEGAEVLFLTGTDEHGEKVAKAAAAEALSAQAFTDKIAESFKALWTRLDIRYDDFIRTTEERHRRAVEAVWRNLSEKGEIYQDKYSGWYCTPCENFWTERQVSRDEKTKKELCPDCKRPVEKIEEENFFFRLSKYQPWLLETVRGRKDFILPDVRRNEVLGFLENNTLQDLCISRPKNRLSWGIPSPLSDGHVTYVWFDALINYISACGYGQDELPLKKWWPADVHIVGKDILRHHAIYWPIMLKALGLEIPRLIFAHGWWVVGSEKMSKTRGNVVDPVAVTEKFGVDPYRYFLLREVPFGFDGTFSEEALTQRFNHDLANDLGNLLHRSLTMCEKYYEGRVPPDVSRRIQNPLRQRAEGVVASLSGKMEKLAFSEALTELWALIGDANRFIEAEAPWKLARNNEDQKLKEVIVSLLEVLRVVALSLWAFMPKTAEKIWSQLGIEASLEESHFSKNPWGHFDKGGAVAKGEPLFPRIETDKKKPRHQK